MKWFKAEKDVAPAPVPTPQTQANKPGMTPFEVPDELIDHGRGDRGEQLTGPPPQSTQAPPMQIRQSRIIADGGAVHGGMLGDDEDAPVGPVDPSGRPIFAVPVETYRADPDEDTGETDFDRLSAGVNPPAPGEKVYQ